MNLKRVSDMGMGCGDNDHQKSPNDSGVSQKTQQGNSKVSKDRIKALVKRKLKPIHQEIIAPPGQ